MTPVNYFIHYTFMEKGVVGDGNVDVIQKGPINSIDDIRSMEDRILKKFGHDSVVITNYIKFIG